MACLGCSNYAFVLAVRAQTMDCWIEAHNRLFAFLGGTPPIIVCDNLKAAVIHAGRSPELNRTYRELAKHYGCIVVPARARHPQDKAKVEACVLFVSRWILACLRHRHFGSLADINQAIAELLERLNQRPFKYLPGCRRSRFLALDFPLLQQLPAEPFEYAEWLGPFKVCPDYHIPVKEHFYSVPSDLVQELVEARVTGRVVEILHKGRRVASHARNFMPGLATTDPAHQPPAHRHYAQQSPERDLDWAKTIGPATTAVVEHQFARWHHSLPGLRACASLRALARDYGAERLESACQRAQAIGSLTVKSIRSILQRRLDTQPAEPAPVDKPLPDHKNLRGPDYYGEGQ